MTSSPDPYADLAAAAPDLPDGIDPLGVQGKLGSRDAFVLAAAVTVALLGLIFTLGWIVYHQLVS